MGIGFLKISWNFLKIWLLFQLCPRNGFAVEVDKDNNAVTESKKCVEADLIGRMAKMETESQQQEVKIEVLLTQLEEEKKFSKQLSGRISQLEASSANPSSSENNQLLERPKRPYRLLPPHVPKEKGKNDGEKNVMQFYGPATNCNDLALLGYTLNGYYLIKKKEKPNDKAKIGVVYCQFQQLQMQKQILETSIGFLNIQTKNVHFHVTRNTNFGSSSPGVVTWQLAYLNEGGAMDLASGRFIVPVSGIYHFEYTLLKDKSSGNFNTCLRLFGTCVGSSYLNIKKDQHDTVSLSVSLRLRANDVVVLWKFPGSTLYDNDAHFNHFSGWLVEEDLSI